MFVFLAFSLLSRLGALRRYFAVGGACYSTYLCFFLSLGVVADGSHVLLLWQI